MLEWTTAGRSAGVRAALVAFVCLRVGRVLGRAIAHQRASLIGLEAILE